MAIDNLYQRCKASDIKLRSDLDEENTNNNTKANKAIPKFRIAKKNVNEKPGSKDQVQNEVDQDTYLIKAKKAIEKLR